MASVTINTVLNSDTLALPELRPLLGKRVEIRVTEESTSAIERMLDTECHAACEAEFAADPSPVWSLAEVRAALSSIPGNLSDDIIADREER